MPLYEMVCGKCGKFEVSRRYDELANTRCPACKGSVRRVYSPFSFTFGFRLSDSSHKKGNPDSLVRNI